MITALVSVWGIFADPMVIQTELQDARAMLPGPAYDIIYNQISQLISAPQSALTWAGFVSLSLALWSAKAGVGALTKGLNAVYGEQNRKGLRHIAVVLMLTMALIAISGVFALLLVVLPVALNLVPLGFAAEATIRLLKWLVLMGMLILALGLVYRVAPNRRGARVAWLTPGAAVATVAWTAVSAAFSVYLENFASYNETYGSLGAVIALLMWFFLSALVVLFGAALNAELERRSQEDSTIGQSRPIGERGAKAADTFVAVP